MNDFISYIKYKDKLWLESINQKLHCKFLNALMPLITYLGSTLFCCLFCIITLTNSNKYISRLGFKSSISIVISASIIKGLKIYIARPRPFLSMDNLNTIKIGVDKYSFPSGHTCAAFTISTMIMLCFPSLTLWAIILSISVGLSRIYTGVHYPSDVIVGSFIGLISSVSTFSFL